MRSSLWGDTVYIPQREDHNCSLRKLYTMLWWKSIVRPLESANTNVSCCQMTATSRIAPNKQLLRDTHTVRLLFKHNRCCACDTSRKDTLPPPCLFPHPFLMSLSCQRQSSCPLCQRDFFCTRRGRGLHFESGWCRFIQRCRRAIWRWERKNRLARFGGWEQDRESIQKKFVYWDERSWEYVWAWSRPTLKHTFAL